MNPPTLEKLMEKKDKRKKMYGSGKTPRRSRKRKKANIITDQIAGRAVPHIK